MVSVMSVNIAAPSTIISELGDTTQGFMSVVIETCSFWFECPMSKVCFTLSNGLTMNPALDVVGVIPMEEVINPSLILGAGSNAPLLCLTSNKVS